MFALRTRSGVRRLLHTLEIAGLNSLAFYIGSPLVQLVMVHGRLWDPVGEAVELGVALYGRLQSGWIDSQLISLVYALAALSLCYASVYMRNRLSVFIKL